MFYYQVISAKYRPQVFKDVIDQEHVVTTLKNAIKFKLIANAYLFSGSRGTGKTTIARIFAKALNCSNLSDDFEPCNNCSSCKEISKGNSLEVIEIDGASNRGIDDIREINENVGYTTGSNKYKIYLIDEVHMLTKEAFNALLKTLEEPPERVKFFFATTEPHKVLPTILSRCQRYHLNRINHESIISKLNLIVKELGIEVEEGSLERLANLADGGLRDAESLLDQVVAFDSNKITLKVIEDLFSLLPQEIFFNIDSAVEKKDLAFVFKFSEELFLKGVELSQFIDALIEHYRLITKVFFDKTLLLSLATKVKNNYEKALEIYNKEQCFEILEFLLDYKSKEKFYGNKQISFENILIYIIRSSSLLSVDLLVRRLEKLERKLISSDNLEKKKSEEIVGNNTSPSNVVIKPKTTVNDNKSNKNLERNHKGRLDSLIYFSAVELDGTVFDKKS